MNIFLSEFILQFGYDLEPNPFPRRDPFEKKENLHICAIGTYTRGNHNLLNSICLF